jgi:DNA ligase-3
MRHWLKMKKDYLDEGTMADTADLVVLGAYYGTGNYGGMKSTFLMGTLNEKTNKWHTVTKCANGLDDKTLAKLQKQIDMIEIKRNPALVPDWLVVNKSLIPDFVVKDPKKSPVWELTGAEFSQSDIHTADGISIRFPRVTKFRDDKSWQEATNLDRLKMLYKLSKEKSNILDEDKNNVAAINQKPAKRTSEESNLDAKSPKKQKSKAKESSDDEDDQFPPLFQNKKFYLASDLENVQKLKRHLIA